MSERPVVLTDGVITLRVWQVDDAPAVFAACQDPLMARYLPIPQPFAESDASDYIRGRRAAWDGVDEQPFAITDCETGDVLGGVVRQLQLPHRAEIAYWLVPAARGRGIATRALRLVRDWSFDVDGLVRLELRTHPDNEASRRVAERAGFSMEGVRRAWDLDRDGSRVDDVFYALLLDDPRP
jgi:RimJ/RimL family protein N-acetyltransferase